MYWKNFRFKIIQSNVRNFTYNRIFFASNHYDALGITPKATQTEVKAAYYELSKLHHPDKNIGSDEASRRFRDITEAYEVLGNVKLRKLYDKGVFHIGRSHSSMVRVEEDDLTTQFYKSREHRTRAPVTGRTPIYDFDEWSRSHYGAAFARDMHTKRKTQGRLTNQRATTQEIKSESVFFLMLLMLFTFMYLSHIADEPDKVSTIKTGTQPPTEATKIN